MRSGALATIRAVNTKLARYRMTFTVAAMVASVAIGAENKLSLKLVAEGFVQPTVFVPIDGGRALIADQLGKVSLLQADGKLSDKPVLDLANRMAAHFTNAFDERGICGLAVHPAFADNRKFYAYYSAPLRSGGPANWNHTSRLSEFTLAGDGVAGKERVLLEIDMPYFNHHSGRMAFGPDGFLYLAVGDGGGANDIDEPVKNNKVVNGKAPEGNAQHKNNLMGKVLRLDLNNRDAGKQYAVPKDNPFAKGGGAPEIFAYGLRNPWGLSFDRGGAHELFLADVGQNSWEEVEHRHQGRELRMEHPRGLRLLQSEGRKQAAGGMPEDRRGRRAADRSHLRLQERTQVGQRSGSQRHQHHGRLHLSRQGAAAARRQICLR